MFEMFNLIKSIVGNEIFVPEGMGLNLTHANRVAPYCMCAGCLIARSPQAAFELPHLNFLVQQENPQREKSDQVNSRHL